MGPPRCQVAYFPPLTTSHDSGGGRWCSAPGSPELLEVEGSSQPRGDLGSALGIHWAPDAISQPPNMSPPTLGPGRSPARPSESPQTPALAWGFPLLLAACPAPWVGGTLVSRLAPEVGAAG